MSVVSIRGAITVENNTSQEIAEATQELFEELLRANNIESEDIIHIIFSMTKDLNAIYPAKALRESFDIADIPLFCVQEADVLGSLEKSIRLLVMTNSELSKKEVKHVYLKGAQKLRPDLSK